jgi:hypothetical protein
MEVKLDSDKVRGVQIVAGQALNDRGFATPEVLFGLAELMGRTLVNQTGGSVIEKLEVLKSLTAHAERTIRMGWIANGGN